MTAKTWGTPQIIQDYIVVGENDEIPTGHKAYVLSKQTSGYELLFWGDWEKFMDGDLSSLKSKIETEIPNTKVLWLKASWKKAYQVWDEVGYEGYYHVEGFMVEAIVENVSGANLSGLEIIGIILALAFLAVVIASIAMAAWIVWEIMQSVPGVAKPAVGIILLILIGLFLLFMFGGGLDISKKRISVKGRRK